MSANNAYKQYRPVPPAGKPAADAVAARVPAVLARVRATPPITEDSVRAALTKAFPAQARDGIEVSAHAAVGSGIGFGMEVGAACVHGWVSTDSQAVEVDGFNNDGGCLPLLGH
jgi:hypothetical protein